MTPSPGEHSVTPSAMPAAPPASAADDALHRLWMDFVEASTRAQRTLVYTDGMAAREAWGRFMTGYAPPRPGDLAGQRQA